MIIDNISCINFIMQYYYNNKDCKLVRIFGYSYINSFKLRKHESDSKVYINYMCNCGNYFNCKKKELKKKINYRIICDSCKAMHSKENYREKLKKIGLKYINHDRDRIEYICKCGNYINRSMNFKKYHMLLCKDCRRVAKRINQDNDIINKINELGYKLVSTERHGNSTLVHFICNCDDDKIKSCDEFDIKCQKCTLL